MSRLLSGGMGRPGALREFLHDEAVGGVALLIGAVAALVWANVAPGSYESLLAHQLDLGRRRRCTSTCATGSTTG